MTAIDWFCWYIKANLYFTIKSLFFFRWYLNSRYKVVHLVIINSERLQKTNQLKLNVILTSQELRIINYFNGRNQYEIIKIIGKNLS